MGTDFKDIARQLSSTLEKSMKGETYEQTTTD
jgi:hypothetical protein